jgi:nucleolin
LAKSAKLDKKKAKAASVEKIVDLFANKKRSASDSAGASAKKAKPSTSDSSSSDSSSDSDSDSDDDKAKKAAPAKKMEVDSDSSSSSDSDSDSEDEKPAAKKAAPAKKADSSSDSSSSSDSDSDSEDEKPAAKKAAPAKKDDSDSSSSSSSDSDSSDDDEPIIKKSAASKAPAPAPAADASGSGEHKIYVKGLPWRCEDYELQEFFKDCGAINSVELPLDADGRSSGTAYIKFAERSGLDAALAMDGATWPGTERWLKIQEGFEKAVRHDAGVKPEGCDTVFVGNLPWDVTEDQLYEIFGNDLVSRVRLATSADDGSFKGFGHVQFFSGDSTDEAVKLAGTEVNGRAIRVDYAPPRDRAPGGGAGGRGGGGRGGGRGGGGRGGSSPMGRGGGGRGAPSAGSANKGSIVASQGKKISFD